MVTFVGNAPTPVTPPPGPNPPPSDPVTPTPPTGDDPGGTPTVTVEYGGTGAGLQAAINALPTGGVLGLVAGTTYDIGSGYLNFEGKTNIGLVGRGATIDRSVRGTTKIIRVAVCNGVTFDGFTIKGRNPNPGKWNLTYEHEHAIELDGTLNFTASRVNVTNIGGDGWYPTAGSNRWSDTLRWHHSTFSGIGRNVVSITDGASNLIFDYNTISNVGLHTFDVEPNGLTEAGITAGALNCQFNYNTIGTKPYGDYPSDPSQMFGYFFVVTGSSGGGPAKVIKVKGNTLAHGAMRVGVFNNNIDAEYISILDNVAVDSFSSEADINTVVTINGCFNVTVTGNTQHISSGTFVSTSGSTGTIVTTPNTT